MLTFIARRLLLAVPVLLGVVFVVMLTVELIPGDAVALMLGEHATPEAVARLRDYLGLDKPLLVRYVTYVGRVARGGAGFLLGDGALTYGPEQIVEAYYTCAVGLGLSLAFDVQHVTHPGYNRDRGPVTVFALRTHLDLPPSP